MNAQEIIVQLKLEPLPHEGGWFRRIHTDDRQMNGVQGDSPRALGSGIYFFLTTEDFSAMHRLSQSVESFHWHAGDPVELLMLHPDGTGETRRLGGRITAGEQPIVIVPRNTWQGSRLADSPTLGYALLTVMVTPEFLWEDFALGSADQLVAQYPQWAESIMRLCRG